VFPAPHAPTAIGASFISKHDGGSHGSLRLASLLARASKIGRPTRGRKGRSKIHAARRVLIPHAHCDWGIISFPNTMEAALLEILQSGGRSLRPCAANRSTNTRKEGSLENSCGPARAQPPHAPNAIWLICQTRWSSATQKFRPGVCPCARACNKAVQRERSVARKFMRPSARSVLRTRQQCDWGITLPKRWRQRYTEIFGPVGAPQALVLSKSSVNTRKEGRSKIHPCGPAFSLARAHSDWGIIYSKHDGGHTEIPLVWRGRSLRSCSANRASNTRKRVALKIAARRVLSLARAQCDWAIYSNTMEAALHNLHVARSLHPVLSKSASNTREGRIAIHAARSVFQSRTCLRVQASFIAKHDGGSATQKFLWPGGRSCARTSNRSSNTRKGRRCGLGACQPLRPMRFGII
jgi:hypothetical protein